MELRAFLLHRQIDLGLSKKEMAFRLGISPSMLSRILRGDRRPPEDEERVKDWSRALRLSPAESAQLHELVFLANSPPYVQRLVKRLRAELRRSKPRP